MPTETRFLAESEADFKKMQKPSKRKVKRGWLWPKKAKQSRCHLLAQTAWAAKPPKNRRGIRKHPRRTSKANPNLSPLVSSADRDCLTDMVESPTYPYLLSFVAKNMLLQMFADLMTSPEHGRTSTCFGGCIAILGCQGPNRASATQIKESRLIFST